jgi:hypothetical protein
VRCWERDESLSERGETGSEEGENPIHHRSGGSESWDPEKEVAGEGENRWARDPGEADPPVGDAGDAILGGSPCKTRDHDPNQENPYDPIFCGDFRRPKKLKSGDFRNGFRRTRDRVCAKPGRPIKPVQPKTNRGRNPIFLATSWRDFPVDF